MPRLRNRPGASSPVHEGGEKPHSPYGTQMFLTWVARARTSRPALVAVVAQSRATVSHQVCFRLPAEAASNGRRHRLRPEVPDARRPRRARPARGRASRSPVTMLTTPPARRRCRAPGRGRSRASGCASRRHDDDAVAHGDRRRHQRDEGQQRPARPGQTMPTTPSGSFIASARPRNGGGGPRRRTCRPRRRR